MTKTMLAAGVAALTVSALADFSIDVDPGAKPLNDASKTGCGPMVGYAGCSMTALFNGNNDWWFGENATETAQAMLDAGAYFQRMWGGAEWFAQKDKKDKDGREIAPVDLMFKFWRANGIKILFTIDPPGNPAKPDQKVIDSSLGLAKYIADNNYYDVCAGFELGNETYGGTPESQKQLAGYWNMLVPQLKKIAPKIELGLPIGEYFVNDPDVKQIRDRLLADKKIGWNGYFGAREMNRCTAALIVGFKPEVLKMISHNIYHCYGAETPYSCSYYGYKRYRNFEEAFPEIKGKRWWLSEIRPRSDEDNRCQRMFREALIMAHYSLMTIVQPEVDGFNHHQIFAISGGIYQSSGKDWILQWRDSGPSLPDYRSPFGRRHLDIGAMGAVYRILAEGIKGHPLFLSHGTSKAHDTEDTFYTSARYTDQVYAARRARKEGKTVPAVDGEVEWVAAMDGGRGELCLLMVNTKQTAEKIKVTLKGREFAAPTYRTVSCPEKFLDCREIPGDAKPWKFLSWEDTQFGFDVVPMEKYEGMKPAATVLTVEIEPNTVQTVTVCTRNVPKK